MLFKLSFYLSKMAQAKDVMKKNTQLHRMLEEGEWVVIFIKQEHYFQAI